MSDYTHAGLKKHINGELQEARATIREYRETACKTQRATDDTRIALAEHLRETANELIYFSREMYALNSAPAERKV